MGPERHVDGGRNEDERCRPPQPPQTELQHDDREPGNPDVEARRRRVGEGGSDVVGGHEHDDEERCHHCAGESADDAADKRKDDHLPDGVGERLSLHGRPHDDTDSGEDAGDGSGDDAVSQPVSEQSTRVDRRPRRLRVMRWGRRCRPSGRRSLSVRAPLQLDPGDFPFEKGAVAEVEQLL